MFGKYPPPCKFDLWGLEGALLSGLGGCLTGLNVEAAPVVADDVGP